MRRHQKTPFSLQRFVVVYGIATAVLTVVALSVIYYQKADLAPTWCLPFETLDWPGGYCYATCKGEASCAALDENYKTVQDTFSDDDRRWYYYFSDIPIE